MIRPDAELLLNITDLHASVEDQPILKGVNLQVRSGEIHAVMGRNGSGKSTLSKVLAGHPAYRVTSGTVRYRGENLFELEAEERARLGVFLGFQYPVEIPGVSNVQFLREALNSQRGSVKRKFNITWHLCFAEAGIYGAASASVDSPGVVSVQGSIESKLMEMKKARAQFGPLPAPASGV